MVAGYGLWYIVDTNMTSKKSKLIPRVVVEPWRRRLYDRALAAERRDNPDITMASWVRSICDARAMEVLGLDELPR